MVPLTEVDSNVEGGSRVDPSSINPLKIDLCIRGEGTKWAEIEIIITYKWQYSPSSLYRCALLDKNQNYLNVLFISLGGLWNKSVTFRDHAVITVFG